MCVKDLNYRCDWHIQERARGRVYLKNVQRGGQEEMRSARKWKPDAGVLSRSSPGLWVYSTCDERILAEK